MTAPTAAMIKAGAECLKAIDHGDGDPGYEAIAESMWTAMEAARVTDDHKPPYCGRMDCDGHWLETLPALDPPRWSCSGVKCKFATVAQQRRDDAVAREVVGKCNRDRAERLASKGKLRGTR